MLQFGMIGHFEEDCERCIIWDFSDKEIAFSRKSFAFGDEIRNFVPDFMLVQRERIETPSSEFRGDEHFISYCFKDNLIHDLDSRKEVLCFTFSTGKLTKIPLMGVYGSFVKDI